MAASITDLGSSTESVDKSPPKNKKIEAEQSSMQEPPVGYAGLRAAHTHTIVAHALLSYVQALK